MQAIQFPGINTDIRFEPILRERIATFVEPFRIGLPTIHEVTTEVHSLWNELEFGWTSGERRWLIGLGIVAVIEAVTFTTLLVPSVQMYVAPAHVQASTVEVFPAPVPFAKLRDFLL